MSSSVSTRLCGFDVIIMAVAYAMSCDIDKAGAGVVRRQKQHFKLIAFREYLGANRARVQLF
jgi:hypothetical protein